MALVEVARLYLGYAGNLQEKVSQEVLTLSGGGGGREPGRIGGRRGTGEERAGGGSSKMAGSAEK